MPNWCNNTFELVGPKEKIREFEQFLEKNNGKEWFSFFAETPKELTETEAPNRNPSSAEELIEKYGASDWYTWNCNTYGCKWNCDAQDWTVNEYDEENLSINFWFDSPWGPPDALYERIENGEYGDDLHVFAEWHEEGMAFVGRFQYGLNENYEYDDLDSLDNIPDELVDNWNLREMLEDRAEWEENDEIDEEE